MLDTFRSETSQDFRQRYRNSYGYFTAPDTGRKVLVFIKDASEEVVHFIDEHSTAYQARADYGLEFEFIPVRRKLFIMHKRLYLVERKPARMWSRGVNMQNTSVYCLDGFADALSFPVVKAAFEKAAPDASQNVKNLESKETHVAVLSDQFGVKGEHFYLYDNPIGSFLTEAREIRLNDNLFRQEVMDLVEKHQLGYRVVVNG